MKKLLYLLLVITGFSNAQIVNIPDANFKAKLLSAQTNNSISSNQVPTYSSLYGVWSVSSYNKIDTNNDGEIQVSEALMVKWLNVSNSNISNLSGIEYFSNLHALNCNGNLLIEINVGQLSNLQYLNCSSNNISTINSGNINSLLDLNCQQNNLSTLNLIGLNNLLKLSCSYNSLNNLNLNNLNQLTSLSCNNNQLTQLNLINLFNLQTLFCASNQIQILDTSNLSNIVNIDCSSNQIMTLTLGNLVNLKFLTCHTNQISQLEIQNLINLEVLYCAANQITVLNFSNLNKIKNLRCGNNLLTTLDLHNCPDLNRLECTNNSIEFLNIKNGVHSYDLLINNLYFQNNPNLEYLCCDESEANTINIIANTYNVNVNIGAYCFFTPGGTFYTIQGNNKYDNNNNGCDANDSILPNVKFNITNGTENGNFISNNSGNYSIPVGQGTHIITPQLENPSYFNVSPTSATVTFPATTSPFNQNFCITPNGIHHDIEVTLIPITPARPGFDATYKIIYKNKGTQIENGAVTLTYLNQDALDIVSCNPAFNSENSDGFEKTLTWNYVNLQPFQTREITVVLNLNGPMETPALNIGETLSMTSTVTPVTNDENPIDNSSSIRQVIVGSYDPNDKKCIEGANITPAMVGEYVHYVIRFENTGTYPAQNVVVKDMIDLAKFDIATLLPIKASHNFETRIAGNKVEFIFENINLPFDDANNDGYVAFKIKTKPTLVLGDTFSNQANIYFDYNFPIITNTATTTIAALSTTDFEFGTHFTLYPNPVKEVLNFQSKDNTSIHSIEIYTTLGQVVLALTDTLSTVDVSSLQAGNYIVKVHTDLGVSNTKFIKE